MKNIKDVIILKVVESTLIPNKLSLRIANNDGSYSSLRDELSEAGHQPGDILYLLSQEDYEKLTERYNND